MLVIYTKDSCGYCIKAKKYLDSIFTPYREINVDHDPKALEFLKKEGHKSVPQLYYNDYLATKPELFVKGGCDGLMALPTPALNERLSKIK